MIGRTLSHYKVLEKIGEGGMGEVYLAKDTKLDREVAVKVLPATFAENKERLARFEREARLLASLNHPNIAAIHELEESDGVHFLALEYVPGETLAERIKRGAIPVDEALPLFKQIAEGLEAAHEKGVIHRDLKPANIKITPEGKVKVLDFGLAKAMAGETPVQGLSESPTITREHTEAGVLLGTAPYMSPEQARGKEVDKKTDIWAFGCCLYEALTGKTAFLGETVSDTISTILKGEPDWKALPDDTPSSVRRLLRRSLEKNAGARLHDIADARLDVEEAMLASHGEEFDLARTVSRSRLPAFVAVAALVGAIIAGTLIWTMMRASEPMMRAVSRLAVTIPRDQQLYIAGRGTILLPALSPDGKKLAYIAQQEDSSRLYLRDLEQFEGRAIPGSEGAHTAFFSPDSRWLAFHAENKLKKVPVTGGAPQTICDVPLVSHGASWGPDGTIIFCVYPGTLYQVSADGGTPEPLTEAGPNTPGFYQWPAFLPGGRSILFTSWGPDRAGLFTLSLKTGEERLLFEGNVTRPRHVPTGHLIYSQENAVMAVPFDLVAMEPKGSALPVVEGVTRVPIGAALFSVSDSGTLAYVQGDSGYTLVTVDRNGRTSSLVEKSGTFWMPGLSPDGRRLAVCSLKDNTIDIWIYDIEIDTRIRLTTDGQSGWPIWTRDGKRITFSSNGNLCWAPADGSGAMQTLLTRANMQTPVSWSPDGKTLAFHEVNPDSGADIYMLHLDGEQEPEPFLNTTFDERAPQFSPGGRWVAYVSNESGRNEVYVRPYAVAEKKWIVSTDGGSEPRWSSDGRELFYRQGSKTMVAVVTTEPSFSIGERRELFDGPYDSNPTSCLPAYDVTPDGKHFVTSMPDPESMPKQIRIVLNWFEELKRLVPTN